MHRDVRFPVLPRASRLILAVVLLSATGCGAAASGPATPATLNAMLARARGGDRITLSPGDYPAITLRRRSFSPALRIEAAGARIGGITLADVTGVEVSGGTVSSLAARLRYGVNITDSRDVRLSDMTITQAYRGVVVNRSERIALVGNRLTGLTSDGIDIALSRHIRVERNSCRDFSPTFATFSADGKRVRDGDHPDCIQAWSRPSAPPTSDLTIIGNEAEGAMQGIFLGNHTRNGVNDGGFDRVVVRDNRVTVSMPNGIALFAVRGGEVRGNVVRTVPGAVLPNKRNVAVKAALRTAGNTNVRMCDNVVASLPRSPGTERCRD